MTYLEFAPYWTVPSTILREDKLPLIKKDPGWLARHNYEIVPWSGETTEIIDPSVIDWKKVEARTFPGNLRMKPGPQNPLGRIKFMFPNRFAVYLHDTPERYLFARDIRSYSSGCIRVERPLDLAQYLLEKATEWDCDMILDAMEADEPLTVNLPASWPIHILYWTAWVDEEGALQFRDDFYLRDLDLELALIRSLEKTKSEAGKMLTAGS
jgi:murein L,D-transpeptidase YcbB/YkuD